MAATRLPPSPSGSLILGNLGEFRRDILAFYSRMAREYGDCVGFRLGWRHCTLVSHPDLIEEVLVHQAKNFAKMTYVLSLLVPLLGEGLLTSDGEFWLRQRRLIQPLFSKQRIASYADCMVEYTERMLAGWRDGETRDLYRDMTKLTLEIVAKTLFDADVAHETPDVGEALEGVMHNFLARWESLIPLPAWLPTPVNLRYHRAIRRLDQIIYRFIAERHAQQQARNDLLTVLLQARDEDGSRMTDRQVRDEAMTLFLAGHETTANALSWTWYLLGRHPAVVKRLEAELAEVLQGRAPTVTDLPRLTCTESVLLESMRLYPPAYAFSRLVKEDCQLGGYRIPAGTTVIVSQWVVHRDPRFFTDPDRFLPERWLEGLARRLPRFAYFPFGGGARLCIGNNFAMMEAQLILATMLQRYRIQPVPDQKVRPLAAVTLRPAPGVQAVVRKRQ